MDEQLVKRLLQEATAARECAYAPYSEFKVGAAVLCHDGTIHAGCNVENGAYGPSNCAERTALFRVIADGYRRHTFQALAVVADTQQPVTPCGVCRQVMSELCSPTMPVIMANTKGDYKMMTVEQLLPGAFSLS